MNLAMVPQSRRKISPVGEAEEGGKKSGKAPRGEIYRPARATCNILARESRGARTKKRSVGRLPLQRLETSLRRFRVATTRSPGFPLDFLRYPIDFPFEREKGSAKERKGSTNCPDSPHLRLSLARVEKKIEFQLDPRGEQGRFVRVNPFMTGAQWRDGNRFENKGEHIEKWKK